ncbi:MAG: signal recognition particle-docking protein FtsY [Syntrophobacteraceae bacterium]|jgi:fused signal recognition particle receptor
MIRWFKRKKKKDSGEVRGDILETEAGEKEEPLEHDIAVGEGQVTAEGAGPDASEEPEADGGGKTEDGGPETLVPAGAEEEEILEEEDEASEEGVPKRGFFRRLRQRLKGTREKFVHRIDRLVLGKKVIDEELLDELEEILITSDLGVNTTGMLLRKVADKVRRKELSDPARLREQIREEIRAVLSVEAPALDYRAGKPFVVMIVGVNGTGKTTTTGKLASQLKRQGLKPMLVAGDTFRAAAVEQLSIWGERTGVPVVKQKSGSDPSAVAFDALDAAVSRDIDVVLMDTAGRMHTKVNLMEELKKIHRVIKKKMPDAPHEVFLVLDASTGQNALSQAKMFKEGIGLTGLILTKLDGTAKGGIIAAICDELQIPVRYIGIGENIDDLRPFDAEEFTNALF